MKFLKSGDMWSLVPNGRMDVHDELPVANYTICRNPISGEYFLEEGAGFVLPDKLYGKIERHGSRILSTFETRRPGTQVGVFLSGLKGSGKTLLAKFIAQRSGLPIIIVNSPFFDERFMRTIQSINQPAVVIFDEFEKLYDSEAQESILTLFDGVYTARNKIMIITCNDKHAVRDHFHNRPSRLRYSIAFNRLETEFIEEYCRDRLSDLAYLEKILNLSVVCDGFNFDMLQTLVDELNRYGGDFEDSIEILNVKPVGSHSARWKLKVITPDERDREWKVNPPSSISYPPLTTMQRGDGIYYMSVTELGKRSAMKSSLQDLDEEEELSWQENGDENVTDLEVGSESLIKVDSHAGVYIFEIFEGGTRFHVIFSEEQKERSRDYNVGRIDF